MLKPSPRIRVVLLLVVAVALSLGAVAVWRGRYAVGYRAGYRAGSQVAYDSGFHDRLAGAKLCALQVIADDPVVADLVARANEGDRSANRAARDVIVSRCPRPPR